MKTLKKRLQSCMENSSDYLDLSGLGLVEIPDEIKDFPNLKWLNLDNNRLTSLKGLPSLPNLKKTACINQLLAKKLKGREKQKKIR